MDYSKRLEQSLTNFEQEAGKLSEISVLIEKIGDLTKAVADEKTSLKKSIDSIAEIGMEIEDDCATLTKFVDAETAARQKLIADVHETVTQDSRQIIDELKQPLVEVELELKKSSDLLVKLIETHKTSQEKFLAELENLLIRYNAKNLENYNNIIAVLSTTIERNKTALEKNFDEQSKTLSALSKTVDANKNELTSALETKTQSLSDEVKKISETLSAIQYIKTAVSAAVGLGIASCAINFLK